MSSFDERAREWDANPVRMLLVNAVAGAIRKEVPLDPGFGAFEYGCGTGSLGFALSPFVGHVTLADSSEGMLEVLREKIVASNATNMSAVKLDLLTDPLPTERYNLVFSQMVLHHINDTGKILADFYALLDTTGYLCIADLDTEDGSFHGQGFDGHKGFDRDALMETARCAGFRNVRIQTAHHVRKPTEQGEREFSVFLMTAEK